MDLAKKIPLYGEIIKDNILTIKYISFKKTNSSRLEISKIN